MWRGCCYIFCDSAHSHKDHLLDIHEEAYIIAFVITQHTTHLKMKVRAAEYDIVCFWLPIKELEIPGSTGGKKHIDATAHC